MPKPSPDPESVSPSASVTPAAVIDELRRADPTADRLGISVASVGDDSVELHMVVQEVDTNFLAMGHGGMIFTLADVAMSYVSNATGTKLATGATIEFLSAVQPGAELRAKGQIVHTRGRASVVDVEVSCAGETVALFRGTTLAVR